jgi:aspartate carbamoyltransferase catalytic subunit
MRTTVKSPHLPFGDQRTAPWYGKDIISIKQFSRSDLEYIFAVAHEMRVMVERVGTFDLLKGKILANLFYEPSTRTSSSFLAAMERLGGNVISISEVRYSSVAKGESLPTPSGRSSATLTSSSSATPSSARRPSPPRPPESRSSTPATGSASTPPRPCSTSFTIHEELGSLENLTVTMLGDLKYGRTVHSLSRLLTLYNAKPPLRLARDPCACPRDHRRARGQGHCPDRAAGASTRSCPTRMSSTSPGSSGSGSRDEEVYASVKSAYVVDRDPHGGRQARTPSSCTRCRGSTRSASRFDDDPRAAYFRQMEYGLYVRMALLAMVLGKA